MTLAEVSKKYYLSMDKLNFYTENGFIKPCGKTDGVPDYSEDEIKKICVISTLLKSGMETDEVRRYIKLAETVLSQAADSDKKCDSAKEEMIKILRRQRCRVLDEIHCEQRLLDELDYMVESLRK